MSRPTEVSIRFDAPSPGDIGRFVLDRQVAGERGKAFFHPDGERDTPLVRRLFRLPAVDAIFLADHTVMVRKREGAVWPELQPAVERVIRTEFSPEASEDSRSGRRRPAIRVPEGAPRGHRRPRERIRVAGDLRWIVTWLVAGAFVAQVLWASFWRVSDGSSMYLLRLAATVAFLVFWLVFTRPAE